MSEDRKILLHCCCAICAAHPISLLKELGYDVVAYFYNPNIYPESEYDKRLEAQVKLCDALNCDLLIDEYDPQEFYSEAIGFESEPEKGLRCDKCFDLRLNKTAQKANELGIDLFSTTIVISPHKNFEKISEQGRKIALQEGLEYLSVDFKKQDGFLKTNKISKKLGLFRQNYCGCEFSIRKGF